MRTSAPARALEFTLYARLIALAVSAALTLPLLPAAASAHHRPAPTVTAAIDVRPAAPARAGRDFFRVREVRQMPVSSPAVVKARPVVKVKMRAPKRVRVTAGHVKAHRVKVVPKHRVAPRKNRAPAVVAFSGTGSVATVVGAALSKVGRPYVWAAAGPNAFDCSGLILWSMAKAGIRVPHQSGAIAGMGRSVPRSQWRAGVVIHYPGHVALVVSSTMMVEAPHAGANVRVTKIRGGGSGRWLF